MKLYTFSFCLLFQLSAEAVIVGQGNIEFGISRDNEESNAGLGMRYNMNRASVDNSARLTSRMQLGSDRGRSLIATAAHEYQYENSFIDNDVYHEFKLLSPRLNWSSSGSHRIDFENKVDEKTDEITTDYSARDEIWNISSGPSFTYSAGRWFDFQSTATVSRQYVDPYYTNEAQFNTVIAKSLSKISQMLFSSNHVCAENDNPTVDKVCRTEVDLGVDTQGKNFSIALAYGVSDDENTKTDVYTINSNFEMNSSSSLGLTAYRIVDSIAREAADFETNTGSTFAIKEGRNIQYLYEWSRTRFEINARRLLSKADNNSSLSEDASFFYDFQLSSNICQSCSLSLNYEYSRFDIETEQKISSFGINKNNSKRLNSSISFRRTERTEQPTYWSVNFLITYTGIASKISNR